MSLLLRHFLFMKKLQPPYRSSTPLQTKSSRLAFFWSSIRLCVINSLQMLPCTGCFSLWRTCSFEACHDDRTAKPKCWNKLHHIWPTEERGKRWRDKQSGDIASVTLCPSEVTCLFMTISGEHNLSFSAHDAVLAVVQRGMRSSAVWVNQSHWQANKGSLS